MGKMKLGGLLRGQRLCAGYPGGLLFFHTARPLGYHAQQVSMRPVVQQASACLDSADRLLAL
jgi:hypothetical protein